MSANPALFDGFWLPRFLRERHINAQTGWQTVSYHQGRPHPSGDPPGITARWPVFSPPQWQALLADLQAARLPPPEDFLTRLQTALATISKRWQDHHDMLYRAAQQALPAYTGYDPAMLAFMLNALDMMPFDSLEKSLSLQLPDRIRSEFIPLSEHGLNGRLRLFESRRGVLRRLLQPSPAGVLAGQYQAPNLVLGYAAGNVAGTAHLISLLAQASALVKGPGSSLARRAPAVLVKNSRQEPILTPLILSALEEIEPALVQNLAILIWDYEDQALQELLVSQADLVLAAAADYTLGQIGAVIERVATPKHPIRFHQHGHKVSFTTIAASYLAKQSRLPWPGQPEPIEAVALLAAIDSIFWDQYGCLSSRVHFIEESPSGHSAQEYGRVLVRQIRLISQFLPRGALPLHGQHNRFEKYAALAASGQVQICSSYEDDFLVVIDRRPWTAAMFNATVNDCQERTIVVRPVADISEVPRRYLAWVPPANLQTMSVAIDGPEHPTWSTRFEEFATAVGQRGVTALRAVGRSPFPQLAYSWDGYLPLDLAFERSPGWFTSVEFESNFAEISQTYQMYVERQNQFP